MRPVARNSLLLVFGCVLPLVLLYLLEQLLGFVSPTNALREGLLFPPRSQVRYETPEFSAVALVNNLGFRDRNFDASKHDSLRALAIGDSFTFGWGVAAEESWPKVLESVLRAEGIPAQIANLGQPGTWPREYAKAAERAIPVLRPDLVIVAVLQGDDLAQAAGALTAGESGQPARVRVSRFLRARLPNLMGAVRPFTPEAGPTSVNENWRSDVATILRNLPNADRQRFDDSMPPSLRTRFLEGQLNPGKLYIALYDRDYLLRTLQPTSPQMRAAIAETGEYLTHIRKVADRYGAKVLVVSVPASAYVSRASWATLASMGFHVDTAMTTSSAPDEAIREAARLARIEAYDVTSTFRTQSGSGDSLYFAYDGHFTPAGNRLFAHAIAPAIRKALLP